MNNLTAKEKAEEIINIYVSKFFEPIYNIHYFDNLKLSKQCALILVDEMIKLADKMDSGFSFEKEIEYLLEVKLEIEKL